MWLSDLSLVVLGFRTEIINCLTDAHAEMPVSDHPGFKPDLCWQCMYCVYNFDTNMFSSFPDITQDMGLFLA